MVKDILREIKQKWFQFIAIAIITMLGVGFYIGIQVTGYDMRITGDQYMEDASVLDLEIRHTLGFDDALIASMQKDLDTDVVGIYDGDSYLTSAHFDDVVKVIAYDENTKDDITLISGRLPENEKEVLVDHIMQEVQGIKLNETVLLKESDAFKKQELVVVGFVESSLFLNLERGQSRLGTGSVKGFIYPYQAEQKNDVYTAVRVFKNDHDLDELKNKINDQQEAYGKDRLARILKPSYEKLETAQKTLDEEKVSVTQSLENAEVKLAQAKRELDDVYRELESGLLEIHSPLPAGTLTDKYEATERILETQKQAATQKLKEQAEAIALIEDPQQKALALAQLEKEQDLLEANFKTASQGLARLKEGIATYHQGYLQYESEVSHFASEKEKAQAALVSAQAEIDEGLQKLDETEAGDWYVFEREDVLIGYREFYQDSDRIEAIGKVFPLIFFGVAILVTLSTVSRMIDESRMQIGVYKALGYSSLAASTKFFGFTFLAWFIGSALGIVIGFYMIPTLIYNAYRIMYLTPDLKAGIVWSYAWLPLIFSFISSVGIAFIKAMSVSKEKTAQLMRPPLPKGGQRIFLEKISFIWQRLSFLYKVSLRNLFRNKTRFLMTIAGIGGSFGLLITGFGLKHSIYSIVDKQFDEIIQYDGLVAYQSGSSIDTDYFADSLSLYSKSVKVDKEDVSLYVLDDVNALQDYIRLQERQTGKKPTLKDDTVVVSEKLALLENVAVGDTMRFTMNDKNYDFTVGAIVENYTFHYIYMPKTVYTALSDKTPEDNLTLFINQENFDEAHIIQGLYENEAVLSVNFLDDIKESYQDMMGNFDIVIWVVVGAAFALELIVLVNLITMNLSERYKEMATLKVLGFYPKELATYLLRENIILTFISLIFGAVFGKYLHHFVIVNAEIDVVMFNRQLQLNSYIYGALITLGISIVVNLIMARRANHVNMSEALKTFDN